MGTPRETLKNRLDNLQIALESNNFDQAAKEIEPLEKYVHIMSEEDRDYYNAAKIGVKERRWN